MPRTSPLHTASWHAARAEQLLRDANTAELDRWWHRPHRRELIARAHVHATLAAALPMETTVYAASDVDHTPAPAPASEHIPGSYCSYDPDSGEPNALHVAIDGADPISRAATLNGLVRVVNDRAIAGRLTPPIRVTVRDLDRVLNHPADRPQFERLLESGAAAGVSGVAYGDTSLEGLALRWPKLADRLLHGAPLRWEPASRQAGDPR